MGRSPGNIRKAECLPCADANPVSHAGLQPYTLAGRVAELLSLIWRQQVSRRDSSALGLSYLRGTVWSVHQHNETMTPSSGQRRVLVQLTQKQVLLGGGAAFLLGGYVFASGWLDWASLFRIHPLLSIPCTLSLFVAPALLYISIRQMTEIGVRGRLLVPALLSATAIGLVVAGLSLWLRHLNAA